MIQKTAEIKSIWLLHPTLGVGAGINIVLCVSRRRWFTVVFSGGCSIPRSLHPTIFLLRKQTELPNPPSVVPQGSVFAILMEVGLTAIKFQPPLPLTKFLPQFPWTDSSSCCPTKGSLTFWVFFLICTVVPESLGNCGIKDQPRSKNLRKPAAHTPTDPEGGP